MPGGFTARQYGDRLAIAAQQGRNPGIPCTKITVGIVAARSDNGIDGRFAVVESDRHLGIDVVQQSYDILHQDGIFRRGLHQTLMSACEHTQQIEKSDHRNISGHDDQHTPRSADGNRVGGQPFPERLAPQHPAGQSGCRTANIRRRKPGIGTAGLRHDIAGRRIASEAAEAAEASEPPAQFRKKFNGIFHGTKIVFHGGICTFYPKLRYLCRYGY